MKKDLEIGFKISPVVDPQKYAEVKKAFNANVALLKDINAELKSGKTLTDEQVAAQAKAKKEIKEQKQELSEMKKFLKDSAEASKSFQGSFDGIAEQVAGIGKNLDFTDKLAKFGLVANGISALADSFTSFSQPFVQLDTATQTMKTLGAEAANLAEPLKGVSLELSRELPFAAGEFQSAMADAMASGVQGGADALAGFAETAAKLATGGNAELGAVVQGLGATLNAFGATADDASKYADYMFNTVNAGVTTIDELNQYLSGVTPTAAAMGLSFDKVGGSLALMTQKGIPTASAVTKLNALFLEMAKPTKGIESALKAAGVSMEDFQGMIKNNDLEGSLKTLQKGFDKMGTSATQAFSSSEAGAAFNTLAGDFDAFSKSLNDVANTTGSTENAYAMMADSIEVRSKQMKSYFDSLIISSIDMTGSFGTFASVAASSFASIAPSITALSGLSTILPTKAIGELGSKILPKLKDGLKGLGGSMGGLTSALKGAEGAQGKLNTTMLANPYVLAVAGIAAVATGLHFLTDALYETAEERKENLDAEKELLKAEIDGVKQRQKTAQSNLQLVEAFKKQGVSALQNADLMVKLAETYPGVIDRTKSFEENLKKLEIAAAGTRDSIKNLDGELNNLNKRSYTLDVEVARTDVNINKQAIEDLITKDFSHIGNIAVEFITGTSNARWMAEDLIKDYAKAIYMAKNSKQLEDASIEFQTAIYKDKKFADIDDKVKKSIIGQIRQMAEAKRQVLDLEASNYKDHAKKLEAIDAKIKPNEASVQKPKTEQAAEKSLLEQYNIVKKKYEEDMKSVEAVRERERLQNGLKKSTLEELKNEDLKIEKLEKQQEMLNEIIKRAGGSINADGVIVSANLSDKQKDEVQKEVTEVLSQVNNSKEARETLKVKANIDTVEAEKQYEELSIRLSKEDLNLKLSIGAITGNEFNVELLKLYEKELKSLQSTLNELDSAKGKADSIQVFEIQKQINTVYSNIAKKQQEVNDVEAKLFTDLQIKKIKETYSGVEAQKRIELLLFDEEYQEKISKAASNEVELNNVIAEHREKRLEILQKYNKKSEELEKKSMLKNLGEAFVNATKGIDYSFLNKNTDALDEQMKKINDSVDELDQQYKKGEIAYSDYITRLNEIDNERTEAIREANDTQKELMEAFNTSIAESFSEMSSKAAKNLQDNLAAMSTSGVDAYTQLQSTLEDTATIFVSSTVAMAAESGKLWKAMTIGLLEAVKAQVATLSALILGQELAKESVFGIPIAAMLTGLLVGALSAAEAAVKAAKFEHGGLVLGGEQLIRINEAGQEFVMNHAATMKNLGAFEEINKRNITIEQYAREKRLTYPEKPAFDNKQINLRFKGLERQLAETNFKIAETNNKLSKLSSIEQISAQTRDAVHSSRTRIHNDVEIHVDDKELITRAEATRRRQIRRF